MAESSKQEPVETTDEIAEFVRGVIDGRIAPEQIAIQFTHKPRAVRRTLIYFFENAIGIPRRAREAALEFITQEVAREERLLIRPAEDDFPTDQGVSNDLGESN